MRRVIHLCFAFIAVAILAALSGCAVKSKYVRPAVNTPVKWTTHSLISPSQVIEPEWWKNLRDGELEALMAQALSGNLDLKIAVSRIRQYRALAGVAKADLYPTVSADASFERSKGSGSTLLTKELKSQGFDSLTRPSNLFSAPLEVAYEIDFLSRARLSKQATGADFKATAEEARAIFLALAATVAASYFEIRQIDEQTTLRQKAMSLSRSTLDILKARYESGLTGETDLLRQQAELAGLEAEKAELEIRRKEAENRLCGLLGKNPGEIAFAPRELRQSLAIPSVAAGIPSALLQRRPDILASEQRLIAANARVGEARAAFFPRISLTGNFGYQSSALKNLLSVGSIAWGLGPRIHIPIFEGGRNRARLESAKEEKEQALNHYKLTVLRAFEEVENALAAIEGHERQQAHLTTARDNLREAHRQVAARFEKGAVSMLEVLEAERSLLAAEEQLLSVYRLRLDAAIFLYKALGGGWGNELP
ncbi:MAG: efflux transporter outer membrane subunit [Acidobacteria bacterium]|nr:efflux transporter outer membrane subunit [Acidobacteriota bacterium]